MYTITFDETTNFERLRHQDIDLNDSPIMIAGFVYNDKGEGTYRTNYQNKELEPEKARISIYYKKVCYDAGTQFPRDLHVDEHANNQVEVRKTKQRIEKTLPEFIKYGTYKGNELLFCDEEGRITDEEKYPPLKRKGVYQIIAILKHPDVKADERDNILNRDDYASNLYLNMVQEMVKKNIFLNLAIENQPEIVFNFPTRRLPRNIVNNMTDYADAGYGIYHGREHTEYFTIIESGYYKALLTEYSRNYRNIEIRKLWAKSITYKRGHYFPQAFFYLADSICSYLSYHINTPYDKEIRNRLNRINKAENNRFFYYEGTDDYYDKAVNEYLKKDLVACLSNLYDGKRYSPKEVRDYYRKKWYPQIEKKVLSTNEKAVIINAIEKLDNMRYSDNLEQNKLLYIHSSLEKIVQKSPVDEQYMYKLYDVGISAFTHTGNPSKANEYYNKCMKYKDSVNADDVQKAEIRYVTMLNDMLVYEKARNQALGIFGIELEHLGSKVEERNFIVQLINKILGSVSQKQLTDKQINEEIKDKLPKLVSRPNLYKTLSSLGQTYAFLRDSMAEHCFLKAMKDIKKDSDYYITESYLLHYYIDNKDYDSYCKYSKEYFGGMENLDDQLSYLIEEGSKSREKSPRFSLGYAMYIYIKAFYYFEKNKPENEALRKKLICIRDTVRNKIEHSERMMKNHPWEIIYKYSALLAIDEDMPEAYITVKEENKKAAKAAIGTQPEDIIRKIIQYGDIEMLSQELNNQRKINNYHRKVRNLWTELCKDGIIQEKQSSDEEKVKDLQNVFTYMYH